MMQKPSAQQFFNQSVKSLFLVALMGAQIVPFFSFLNPQVAGSIANDITPFANTAEPLVQKVVPSTAAFAAAAHAARAMMGK